MQLSIIIINFNTPKVTLECLHSIKVHSAKLNFSYEIILIDNAPMHDYKNQFESCTSNLSYIKSEKNIGFGRANNLGMEVAKGKYFLLLNSDTVLINNSLQKCYDFMELESSSNIGLLGCKLLNEDLSYQHSFYPYSKSTIWNYFKSNNPLLYKLFNVQKDFCEINKMTKVGDVSGAFMFLRKSVYTKLNGFDPDFFLYCEETEWCRNRIAKHYDIVYYPEATIVHLGGKSAPKELMYLQSQLSLALFWYKKSWGNYFLYIILSWFNGMYFTLSCPFSNINSKYQIKQYLKGLIKTLPYLFWDIPKYKRTFGARKKGLYIAEAKSTFFE